MAENQDYMDHESSDEDFESADEGEIEEPEENEQEENPLELKIAEKSETNSSEKSSSSTNEEKNEQLSNEVPRLSTLTKAKVDTAKSLLNSSNKENDKVDHSGLETTKDETCHESSKDTEQDGCQNIVAYEFDDPSKVEADQEISCHKKSERDLGVESTSEEETTNIGESQTENTTLSDESGKSREPSVSPPLKTESTRQDFQSLFSGWGWSETPSAPATTPAEEDHADKGDGAWGWGNWGNVLSQATSSLSTVIESVEASLGVPDPGKLAHRVKEEENELKTSTNGDTNPESNDLDEPENGLPGQSTGIFSSFGVSSLTSVVQNKGKELMSGGLGALEFLGKKTMDVISEGDPALRKKREAIGGKGPTLSQVLREAKQETEQKAAEKVLNDENSSNLVCFSTEFDEFQGLAHLEALEMLSHQSEAKVESILIGLSGNALDVAKYRLRTMQEEGQLCEDFEEDENKSNPDFAAEITENLMALKIGCVPDKLTRVDTNAWEWLDMCVKEQDKEPGSKDTQEIYSKSISILAELTARGVEQFHKIAELTLLQDPSENNIDSVTLIKCVKTLTEVICYELSTLSSHCAGCLNTAADDSETPGLINPLITSVYLEAANSSSYIQDAYKLVSPILQLAVLKKVDSEET